MGNCYVPIAYVAAINGLSCSVYIRCYCISIWYYISGSRFLCTITSSYLGNINELYSTCRSIIYFHGSYPRSFWHSRRFIGNNGEIVWKIKRRVSYLRSYSGSNVGGNHWSCWCNSSDDGDYSFTNNAQT